MWLLNRLAERHRSKRAKGIQQIKRIGAVKIKSMRQGKGIVEKFDREGRKLIGHLQEEIRKLAVKYWLKEGKEGEILG